MIKKSELHHAMLKKLVNKLDYEAICNFNKNAKNSFCVK